MIADYLTACENREIKRLIINIPPGYLKSISVNVAWPAWLLGHNPSERIVSASYSEALSLKHSVDTRHVLQSEWYQRIFPSVKLVADQNTKQKFVTTERGQRYAVSVGGTVTGDGGNILIVDDPINPKEAASNVEREAANTWFDQTYTTRLRDKKNGVIVVIMQRLNEGDLTGHLLEKGGWEHLCIPAQADKKEYWHINGHEYSREPGEILHPEREGEEELKRVKRELGSLGYAGQYQQRPAPAEGNIYKDAWFPRCSVIPDYPMRTIHSWDTAYKKDQHNDPSACVVAKVRDQTNQAYIQEVFRDRMEYPELRRKILEMAARDNPDAILIEDKASGQSLLQELRNSTTLPVVVVKPEGDKLTRAVASSATCEAGRIILPEDDYWMADFLHELMSFPNAKHDDQVDALSQFINWWRSQDKNKNYASLLSDLYGVR